MMRFEPYALIVGALVSGCSHVAIPATHDHQVSRPRSAERLCDLLTSVQPGEHRVVTTSGVYIADYEDSALFDPNEVRCQEDVQPEVWIEFAPGVRTAALSKLMETSGALGVRRRAYVTFTGILYGPGAIGPDDRSFPSIAAFANRTANRRYGHLSGYRVKLVVEEVNQVAAVPDSVPWTRPSGRSTASTPVVERAEVPRYPAMAWNAGISGSVTIEVTVTAGEVSATVVKSGDRMLSGEAVKNVKTWQFAPGTNATFTATFVYDLEQRSTGASSAPRIELRLPETVHITAASNGW